MRTRTLTLVPVLMIGLLFLQQTTFAQVNLLTQGFEALPFPPVGWSNVRITGPTLPGNWARVTNGLFPVQTPHTGSYQIRYNAHNFAAGTSGEIRTAVLNFTTEGVYTVSFWMYRDSWVSNDKLEVFVNTAQTSVGGTLLGSIYRNRAQSPTEAANGWYQYTFTIPPGFNTATNYLIFKATSDFGNDIYLDDISVDRLAPSVPACASGFYPLTGAGGVCINESLSWDFVPLASGYRITIGNNAPDYNNVANALDLGVAATYSTFLDPSTTYTWKVIPYNGYGDAIGCMSNTFTTGTSTCYCIPVYLDNSCGSEDFIDDFSTSGGATNITNNNSGCGGNPNNFTFFSAQNVTAQQGNTFNVSMQSGPEFAEGFGIWVDWNIDGDFADAGEYVFNSTIATLAVVNGSITVPYTAIPGVTRMRVRCAYNYVPAAGTYCSTFNEGETEDYVITVTPCPASTYYADADGDGYGDPAVTTLSCTGAPTGFVADNTDCNDASFVSHPGGSEVCNALDDDCDISVDEGLTFLNYYVDADADTYGSNVASPVSSCAAMAGYSLNNLDCNDANAAIKPGAIEVCNTLDDDCDVSIDEGLPLNTYWADADGDGFGNTAVTTSTCGAAPSGYVANHTDCNDGNALIKPGAVEVCNAIDDDCDVIVDEGTIVATITAEGPTTFCKGSFVTLSANTEPGYTYQWRRNGTALAGATNISYTATMAGNYSVTVTIPGGCSSTSPATNVATLPSPTASIVATMGTDLCGNPTLELRANNGVGFTWQWVRNGADIAGATSRYYYATTTGNYRVRVTNASGCSKTSATTTLVKTCREADPAVTPVLLVYPNPSADAVYIDLQNLSDQSTVARIDLIDAVGKVVLSNQATITDGMLLQHVDVSSLAAGMYVIHVLVGDTIYTHRLVVNN